MMEESLRLTTNGNSAGLRSWKYFLCFTTPKKHRTSPRIKIEALEQYSGN